MKTKELIVSALSITLGIVLPIMMHGIPNAGMVLLPMHLPILLCGLSCGPMYGLIVGVLTPFLSGILTGMPPAAMLPSMICELAVYGLIAGILIQYFKSRKVLVNIFGALIGAMLAGRVVFGLLNALVFRAGAYSLQMWLMASFVTALPGIVLQLVVIPFVVMALKKGKLMA